MNHDQGLTREASMPVLTRRGFIGGTALTAATLAVPEILRGQAAQPARKIKLGVVGCGGRDERGSRTSSESMAAMRCTPLRTTSPR